MPELPEVETQVRDLQILVGHKILAVSTDTPKAFRPAFKIFQKRVEGKKILAIERRAKYIIFTLSAKLKLVAHFRMTGHFLLAKNSTPLEKCIRHFFKISGGTILQFSDMRKFGTLELLAKNSTSRSLEKLGAEPLDRNFTLPKFHKILKNKKGKLKAFLLDQKNVAGIGNIYADEICFAAKLHPASRVEKFNTKDVEKIFHAIKNQLRKGIKNRGTTIGEYVDTRGQSGRNQLSLMAYKQYGQPCKTCGTKMQKMKIVQRTTSFCPKCQKGK
jgi:formamidopyrimidine-DNA glycosylase